MIRRIWYPLYKLYELSLQKVIIVLMSRLGGTITYSQDGEDVILFNMLKRKKQGFYVDVGAHDPVRFSNTKIFYDNDWSGINIDPLPGMKSNFDQKRGRDINLEMGISDKAVNLKYYMFNEPALNGFSKDISEEREKSGDYKIVSKVDVPVEKLAKVFERYIKPHHNIDFISIDTEGYELNVLKSNDWVKYRPDVVLVEILSKSIEEVTNDPIYIFLSDKGYRFVARTNNTCFFRKI